MTVLESKKVLVVEDEAMLGMELCANLEDAGLSSTGPCMSVDSAITCLEASVPLGAILDVDLQGQTVFPVADLLTARGVPFVFHTGRADLTPLLERYSAPICEKPSPTDMLVRRLTALIDAQGAVAGHPT